jgi:hypothetical protein
MTLAARLVLQTGATVIVARCERKSWGRGYTLYLEELPVPESQSLEATVALINHAMETTIRQSPQQYLWGYGRYKQPREDKQLSGRRHERQQDRHWRHACAGQAAAARAAWPGQVCGACAVCGGGPAPAHRAAQFRAVLSRCA